MWPILRCICITEPSRGSGNDKAGDSRAFVLCNRKPGWGMGWRAYLSPASDMLGRLPIAREVGGGERGPRSGWCVVNVNADAVLLLAQRGKGKMQDAATESSLTDAGDEDKRWASLVST